MNRFKVNLHPAFFNLEGEGSRAPEPTNPLDNKDKEGVIQEEIDNTVGEATGLADNIVENTDFPNIAGEIASEISSQYTDMNQLNADRKRFGDRVRAQKEGENKTYAEVWTKKITEGWGLLLTALEEEYYFEDCGDADSKAKKQEEVKQKYIKEVKNQYKDNVWYAGESKYQNTKDNLFGIEDPKSPANKVYCKLAGASTILSAGRSFREGYGIDDLMDDEPDPEGSNDNADNGGDSDDKYLKRKDRNFLSRDLPQYLWNIKGRTAGNLDFGIVSVEEDRSSKVDRKAIKQFLKAAGKITTTGGRDNAVALMEAFRDDRLTSRSGSKKYEKVLKEHGISVAEGDISAIVKAGTFYINTQRSGLGSRDQHAIYLDVLTIIEKAGGAEEAIKQNKEKVENAKGRENGAESGYADGEVLKATNKGLYDLAVKLGIKDFTSATRLSRKTVDYFKNQNTPVEKILANLNNDEELNAGDFIAGGQKSGQQFLEMLNQINIGKDAALNNLYERAVLEQNVLGNIGGETFTKENVETLIRQGNVELILLLQNIISKPGEDLYTLLSGRKEGESTVDGANPETMDQIEATGEMREQMFKKAGEIIKENIDSGKWDELRGKDGIDVANFADLQASLASFLYDNYKVGVGTSAHISFDEWAKGLSIGLGAQARNKGGMLGLNISYNADIYNKNGRTVSGGLSAGVFLPIASGSKKALASAGINFTADKVTIDPKLGIAHHRGVEAGFNFVTATVHAGRYENRDKLEGLEVTADAQSKAFEQVVVWDVIDEIKKNITTATGDGSAESCLMDLNNPDIVEKVRTAVKAVVDKQKDIQDGDKEGMINGMLRMLTVYNNTDLSKPGVKYLMAKNIAEQYKMSWLEQRKIDIQNEGSYISGYSLGAFWKVGTPLVGVYATISESEHELDAYGDRTWNQHEQQENYQEKWTQELLDSQINQKLRVNGTEKALKLEGDFIVIPDSMVHRVKVTEKMKELMIMKKDEKGNVYIDPRTPMAVDVPVGAAATGGELILGGKKGDKCERLGRVGDDYFTSEIDQNRVSELREGIDEYNQAVLDKALDQLKASCPGDKKLEAFTIEGTAELFDKLNKINKENHKVKLTIKPDEHGELKLQEPEQGGDGKGLEIEYQSSAEIINENVKDVADAVYGEALKVRDPNTLHEVKHKPWLEWDNSDPKNPGLEQVYHKLIQEGAGQDNINEKAAKDAVRAIFTKLDTEYKKIRETTEFSNIAKEGSKFDNLTGDDLVQALMSIKNIFARSRQVRGGNGKYEFKTWKGGRNNMLNIINQRSGILETLKTNITDNDDAKGRYEGLFKATSKYVNTSANGFNIESTTAAPLKNTVGFNLGDKTNPENPLFDPEIYEPMVDLSKLDTKDFTKDAKEGLHKRAMSLFAKNPALINPILERLGLERMNKSVLEGLVDKAVKNEGNNKLEIKDDGKCQLTLDIGGKIITIKAGMKFGFFTQCVNHTIILDDIEGEGNGNKIKFESGVVGNSHISEGTGQENMATTRTTIRISTAISQESGGKPDGGNQYDATTEQIVHNSSIEGVDGTTDQDIHNSGGTFNGGSGGGDGGGDR